MLSPFSIATEDRHGRKRSFQVSIERDDIEREKLYVRALEDGANPLEVEGFQVTLTPHGATAYRIDAMTRHPSHAGAGIPDSLLPELSKRLGRVIVSSSNRFPSSDREWRSMDAEKMWRRLVSKGLAAYDAGEDRFSCPP